MTGKGMKNLEARDLPYWKTSRSDSGTWLDRAERVITDLGGTVKMTAKGRHEGRVAFAIDFEFPPDAFRAVWPVMSHGQGEELAAERQAATMLYHDVKARSLRAAVFGPRTAFFDFLLLKDGRTASHLTNEELIEYTPQVFLPSK